ncbi:MAG TPA: hypothetical protein V6C57_07035 [Coleofasciculaceae cyanobacterium]
MPPAPPPTSQTASSRPRSGRVAATAIIWGCAMGMLAISLPLSSEAQGDTLIAIAIILATAISTVTVWLSAAQTPEVEATDQLRQLQERLGKLEAVAPADPVDWLPQVEPSPLASTPEPGLKPDLPPSGP